MDQWKSDCFHSSDQCTISGRLANSHSESSQMLESEVLDSITVRKVQKADREKLRRDRLNEQFVELGNALDPGRPKNDKGTILSDAIQTLKDLSAQVDKLKAEYAALSEESCELTQEKNELREEKATIKSDIDNLYVQYQQRLRVMLPWTTMDPSLVMPHLPYPYPMPVPIHTGPLPMHPPMQSFPFYRNLNPGTIPPSSSTFLPFPPSHCNNPLAEQTSAHYVYPHSQPISRSQTTSRQDSRKSSDRQQGTRLEKTEDSSDVATELELKTPGSVLPSSHSESTADQVIAYEEGKVKQYSPPKKMIAEGSCSTKLSSSRDSSASVGDIPLPDN